MTQRITQYSSVFVVVSVSAADNVSAADHNDADAAIY